MEHKDQLENKKYRNWVRAALGIKYVKDGLEPFCDHLVNQQHVDILDKVKKKHNLSAVSCGQCDVHKLQPDHVQTKARHCPLGQTHCNCLHPRGKTSCPSNVCGAIYDEIIGRHASTPPAPYWRNTDTHQWCTEPWAVAKCFINAPGYEHKLRATEFDCPGLLHLLINNLEFHQHIQCRIDGNDAFSKVLQHRNDIFHCDNMELEDTDFANYVDDMIELLQDDKEIKGRQESTEAVKKLHELKQEKFIIATTDETEVRRIAMAAIEEKEKNLEQRIVEIGVKTDESEKQIKVIGLNIKDELEQKRDEMKDNLRKTEIDSIGRLEKREKEIIEALKMKEIESTKKTDQKERQSKDNLRMTEVDLKQKLKQKELDIKKNLKVIEVNLKESLKHEEILIKKNLRVVELEAKGRLDQKRKEIEKYLERKRCTFSAGQKDIQEDILYQRDRKQLAQIQMEARRSDDISKVAAGALMQSSPLDMPLQSNYERMRAAGQKDIQEDILYQRDRRQLAQIQMEARRSDDISKAAAGDLMKSSSYDTALQSNYERMRAELKDDLIDLYRDRHHTLPLSPLFEINDTPLVEFYVMPDINSVEIQRSREGCIEVRSKVTSLHDIFYKDNQPCRKIYLIADAGFGKTALSKRLVLTWCQAKNCIQNEDEHFMKEDISTMSNFDFVFLLSLRDCSEEWDIDEMIKKQIIIDLAHTISTSDFENILSKERCLIILDGLDEFTHAKSDIPHRKARRKCTILTTTRPWKLGVSKIRSSEIERKLELIGLSETSSKRLKRTVISLLFCKADIDKHIQDFDRAISDRGISDLETIPLLQMYLLCLWCDGIELGASRTELYCQTVELLLKRTFEKYSEMQQSQSDIPQCFSEHEHCKGHYTFLQALGQLAFETLFSEIKESTLVFSQSMTEKHLTPEYLKLSLDSGILTQSTEKTLTKQISKFSFSHKTVHEFFCALYISCQNESDVKNIVVKKCKSLQSILDMSTVLVFVSGMVNAEIISAISQEFLSVIGEDDRTITTTDLNFEPLNDIQDMYISCMKENTSDKELKLFCQDFFFCKDHKEEEYFSNLTRLAVHNKNNMESIYINTWSGGPSLRKIIDSCGLHELFQINKIFYWGLGEETQLPVLLNRSSKCVAVISPDLELRDSWSREMWETLQNNSLLQAIYISSFKMSHDVLKDFLDYIINRKTMTEIKLRDLPCLEHGRSCSFSLDFSQHSGLRKLELQRIPEISQLKVNSQVRHLEFGGINLGERSLPPEMAHIECVVLYKVNMSASTLRDLVKVVEKLSHKVTVSIRGCEIEPETEFEDIKQYIHSSKNFRVTKDELFPIFGYNRYIRHTVFETKIESYVTK